MSSLRVGVILLVETWSKTADDETVDIVVEDFAILTLRKSPDGYTFRPKQPLSGYALSKIDFGVEGWAPITTPETLADTMNAFAFLTARGE